MLFDFINEGSEFPSSEGFMHDSTGIRFDKFFWIIGGDSTCDKKPAGSFYGIAGQGNKNSYLWHVDKNRWVKGPLYHKKINKTFHYSCALALNKSSILFIGLVEVGCMECSLEEFLEVNDGFANKYSVIYNFDTKLWIDQESLNYHRDDIGNFEYTYLTACNIHHGKKKKR